MTESLSTRIEPASEEKTFEDGRPAWLRSLLTQMALGNILILLIFSSIISISVSHSVNAVSDHFTLGQLERDAAIVGATLEWRLGHWQLTASPNLVRPLMSAESPKGFAVIDSHGRIFAGSQGHESVMSVLQPRLVPDSKGQVSTLSYASKRIRAGNDYADVVIYRNGSNLYGIQDQGARSIAISLCVFVASILAASQLVGMLLLFLMMRGVRRATREAAMIGPDNLDQRISMGDVPEDIRGLVAATNAALDRVEEGYRLQGRFAGAVAHELRTPIAVLRLKCEALPISPQRDGLIGMVDRLTHILGQLMALALLEGATPNLETADLVEVVREITINLVEEVHISGRTLEFSAPVLAVPGRVDVHYMTTILGNLVGNAIAHTRPGSHIVVGIHESGIVYVVDDGPGMILAPSLATAQPRYRRADGKRTGGLGLGLRIVARSVELMGGELDIVTGGPGCQIRITLPQA